MPVSKELNKVYPDLDDFAQKGQWNILAMMNPEFLLCRELSGSAYRLLMMFNTIQRHRHAVIMSKRDMAQVLSIHSRTVHRAIDKLSELNIVVVKGQRHKRSYHVQPSKDWTGPFANHRATVRQITLNTKSNIGG